MGEIHTAEPLPACRRANRTKAAEFFGVAPTTLDAWVRKGAPVVRPGSRGIASEFDLLALAEWRFADAAAEGDYAQAKAAHDFWRAKLSQQEFEKRAGNLLDRAQVEQAAATVLATVAQTLRSIPDNLERVAGLSAEQAEEAERIIDSLCLSLHDKLKRLGGWG